MRGPLVAKSSSGTPGRVLAEGADREGRGAGLTNRTGGSRAGQGEDPPAAAESDLHGDFHWLETVSGLHKPLISRDCSTRVQDVFAAANRPRHTKRRHAFAGLLTCGRCGCAITAEIKKGQYVYYHCTGYRGRCGNTYVREEELIRQFGEILKDVRIPAELAGKLATVLRGEPIRQGEVRPDIDAAAATAAVAASVGA